jgi:hypothetical protein
MADCKVKTCFPLFPAAGASLFGEYRQHAVAHQMHRLVDGADIGARLEAFDAAFEDGTHVCLRQNLPFDQMFEKCQRGHAVGDGDGLIAAAQKAHHGVFSISSQPSSCFSFITPAADWIVFNLPGQDAFGILAARANDKE